jgi:hypothetical protein
MCCSPLPNDYLASGREDEVLKVVVYKPNKLEPKLLPHTPSKEFMLMEH